MRNSVLSNYNLLKPVDFEKAFLEKLTPYLKNQIIKYKFQYQDLTTDERDALVRRNVDVLLDPNIIKAGKHRYEQWEKSWQENYQQLSDNQKIKAIIPKYFGKYQVIRWKQDYIKPLNNNFEYNSLCLIVDWLFDKYIREAGYIYEFGCGTGYHLLKARRLNKNATICGLDWVTSSQKIIKTIAKKRQDSMMSAKQFDFFNPDKDFKLHKDSTVYTVAALEQTGTNFKKFINYLISNKPKICFHIEPIAELLDSDNLLDYLSLAYFRKRNYLWGLLDYLRKLEKAGKVKIHQAQRTYMGSLFIDGYSVIAWSPR